MTAFRNAMILNILGAIVLIVGISSAVIVYWLGQKPPALSTTSSDWKDSSLSAMDSKTSTRNIELYGGKVEILMVKLLDWLHRPESLPILIVAISALMALSCFLIGRQLDKFKQAF